MPDQSPDSGMGDPITGTASGDLQALASNPAKTKPNTAPEQLTLDGTGSDLEALLNNPVRVKHVASARRPKAAPKTASTPAAPTPAAAPAATAPGPSRQRPAFKTRRRADRRVLVIGTSAAVAASLITVLLVTPMMTRSTPSGRPSTAARATGPAAPSPEAAPSTQPFDRKVPPGWSTQVAWSTPIKPGSHPALADGLLALLTPDRHLQVRYGSTGALVWQSTDILPSTVTASPVITKIDDTPVVLLQSRNQALTWQVTGNGTQLPAIELPDGAQITTEGHNPLVSLRDRGAAILSGGRLSPVTLPARTIAMAADTTGVIAGDPTGVWWLIRPAGQPQRITPAKPPAATKVTRLAAAGHGLLALVWSTSDKHKAIASLADAATGKVIAHAPAPAAQLTEPVWMRDATGQSAALGPVIFDLANRTAQARPGMVPLAATGTTVYGQVSKRLNAITSTSTGTPVTLPSGTAVPWGLTAGNRAVFAGRTDTGVSVFALDPTPNP